MNAPHISMFAKHAAALACLFALAGCSMLPTFLGGKSEAPRAAELAPNPNLLNVRQGWSTRVGPVESAVSLHALNDAVVVAASDGTVAMLDAATGVDRWRHNAGAPLLTGVGSDGSTAAVVTNANEVVAFAAGGARWRQRIGAQAYTAPLVAGGRVFVLAADRSVTAFDGATGRRLWSVQRQGDPLVLRQAGVLMAVGDTLVAGFGGRLVGLNPNNGASRWEAPVATPRGTNDIERLVDLVGGVSRVASSVCVRAFQTAVGCVDAARGVTQWSKPANGAVGVQGDSRHVYGTERDGKVVAWRRDNGERVWTVDALLHRSLSVPALIGRYLAIGDNTGFVHVLSGDDGRLANRLSTDGTAVTAAPVRAGNTLVVATRGGNVYGFVAP